MLSKENGNLKNFHNEFENQQFVILLYEKNFRLPIHNSTTVYLFSLSDFKYPSIYFDVPIQLKLYFLIGSGIGHGLQYFGAATVQKFGIFVVSDS